MNASYKGFDTSESLGLGKDAYAPMAERKRPTGRHAAGSVASARTFQTGGQTWVIGQGGPQGTPMEKVVAPGSPKPSANASPTGDMQLFLHDISIA